VGETIPENSRKREETDNGRQRKGEREGEEVVREQERRVLCKEGKASVNFSKEKEA